uniref:Uncharacterized protein n=1 Tax=Trichobilharzia regenti TaxID=157069 RepID=A0AA85IYT7_TRIRE|nr:unnamed protein product [Trichobilharzia regenti]
MLLHSKSTKFEMSYMWTLLALFIVFSGVVLAGGSGGGSSEDRCKNLKNQLTELLSGVGQCRKVADVADDQTKHKDDEKPTCSNIYALTNITSSTNSSEWFDHDNLCLLLYCNDDVTLSFHLVPNYAILYNSNKSTQLALLRGGTQQMNI